MDCDKRATSDNMVREDLLKEVTFELRLNYEEKVTIGEESRKRVIQPEGSEVYYLLLYPETDNQELGVGRRDKTCYSIDSKTPGSHSVLELDPDT